MTDRLATLPGFEVDFDHLQKDVTRLRYKGMGFLVSPNERLGGEFDGLKQVGCAVLYRVPTGETLDIDVAGKPCSPNEFEAVVLDGMVTLIIRNDYSGPGLLHLDDRTVCLGDFQDGKRIGEGLMIDLAEHRFQRQLWKEGEDKISVLDLAQPQQPTE